MAMRVKHVSRLKYKDDLMAQLDFEWSAALNDVRILFIRFCVLSDTECVHRFCATEYSLRFAIQLFSISTNLSNFEVNRSFGARRDGTILSNEFGLALNVRNYRSELIFKQTA